MDAKDLAGKQVQKTTLDHFMVGGSFERRSKFEIQDYRFHRGRAKMQI